MNHIKSRILSLIIFCFVVAMSIGCATFTHKYIMRGQILDIMENEVYLCIGTRDGAKEGQVLQVYRIHRVVSTTPSGRGGASSSTFKRERVGAVKILTIVDEHYAKALVTDGKPIKNDIVETE